MIRGAVVVSRAYESLPLAPVGPSGSEWARHANDRRSPLGRIPAGVLLGVLFLVLVGVTLYFGVQRSASGEVVDDGRLTLNELHLGDCFDFGSASGEDIQDVMARPCADAHQFEVFWIGTMTDGDYPSNAAFQAYSEDHCYDAFASYLGVAFADTWLDFYHFHPNENGWKLGDRSLQCAAFDPDNSKLRGSLKGVGPQEVRPLPL
jgi:hypothetical protein